MSFSNTAETAINNYIFVGTDVSWNANTDLWLALCTADPGEAGSAGAMSETNYTSYARVAVARATGFTVSGATVENAGLVQFPISTGGSSTVTHVSIVTSASGAGTIIVSGALNASQTIVTGNQPQFSAGDLVFTLD
jgi:hypothetical protein